MLRSLTLEASFTYERFQGTGYCYCMIPALQKIYPNKEDFIEALKRHITFFNTTPHLSSIIMGMSIAMEEEVSQNKEVDPASVNAIKVAMMGPLAGVGDSIFWGVLRMVAAGIGCTLGLQGSIFGPILFLVLFNIPHLLIRYQGILLAYQYGKKLLSAISESNLLEKISLSAGIMGLMVIGGMTVSMVGVTTPLVINLGSVDPLVVQDILDSILPGALSLVTVFVISGLLKKQTKMITLMLGCLAVGIVGVFVGIL